METKTALPISIVIPTWIEEKNIGLLIKQLKEQEYPPKEIIVADANSPDNTVKIARECGAKVVQGGIQAVGRNNGAKIAQGEYLLFIDADTQIPSRTFLKDLLSDFEKNNLDCATCYFKSNSRNLNLIGHPFAWIINRLKDISSLMPGKHRRPEWGALILVKRNVFFDIGGFRENLRYFEDSSFVSDLIKKGYKYHVVPQYIYVDLVS